MTPPLPWIYEPCENEGPICDPTGTPWSHAVRGRKPAGRLVIGYGHTEPAADHDAREKAQRYDAREMIGERGEVINTVFTPSLDDVRRALEEWQKLPHRWIV